MGSLDRHDLGIRGNTDNADPVISLRGDDAGNVGAVTVVILRIAIVIERRTNNIGAVNVVYEALLSSSIPRYLRFATYSR